MFKIMSTIISQECIPCVQSRMKKKTKAEVFFILMRTTNEKNVRRSTSKNIK